MTQFNSPASTLFTPLAQSPFNPHRSPFLQPNRRQHHQFRSLVDQGPQALEEQLRSYLETAPPEAISENPRAAWQTALEVLDTPGNAVRNLLFKQVGGITPTSKEQFAGMQKVYGSDFLQSMGWQPESTIGKVGQFIAGLTTDFLLDPLTWLAGLGGAAAGTVIAPGAGTAAGAALGTSAVSWIKNLARGAQTVNKGITVSNVGRAAFRGLGAAERAASRVHIKPQYVDEFVDVVQQTERLVDVKDPYDVIAEAAKTFQQQRPDALYKGRWGMGFGTTPARTTPLGDLVMGPALVAGKAATIGTELTGQVAQAGARRFASKVPGSQLPGKGLEWLGRALQVPLDAAGAVSQFAGTPLKFLPKADRFTPFREMPRLGPALDNVAEALQNSERAVSIGQELRQAGGAIKEAAATMGIGPKTPLMALALQHMEAAKRGMRADTAPGGLIHELESTLQEAAKDMNLPKEVISQIAINDAEYMGVVYEHLNKGEYGEASRSIQQLVKANEAALSEHAAVADVMKSSDEIYAAAMAATGTGTHAYLREPELMPLIGDENTPSRRLRDIAQVWTDQVAWREALPAGFQTEAQAVSNTPRIPLQDGDLIITRIGGKVQRYSPEMDHTTLPRNFIAVRMDPERMAAAGVDLDPDFFEASITASLNGFHEYRDAVPLGTAQQFVRATSVGGIPVRGNTPLDQQQQFAAKVRAVRQTEEHAQRLQQVALRARRQVEQSVPELLPTDGGGKKKPPPRVGITRARKTLASRFEELRDVIDPEVFDQYHINTEMPAGYVFKTQADLDQFATYFNRQELGMLMRSGKLKVDPDKIVHNHGFEDVLHNFMDANNTDQDGAMRAMAQAVRQDLPMSDERKVDRLIEWWRDQGRDAINDPFMEYELAVYEAVRDGDYQVTKQQLRKEGFPFEGQEIEADQLQTGMAVNIAGRPYDVTNVDEYDGGRVVKLEADGDVIYTGNDRNDQSIRPFIVADPGSLRSQVLRKDEKFRAGFRSEQHGQLAQAVRKAGLNDEQAMLFDAAIEDIAPENLAKLQRVDVVKEQFAGMYDSLRRSIAYGEGNLHRATEGLHEVGHFAFDHIFTEADRKKFATWWLGKSPKQRIALVRGAEGAQMSDTLVRYIAGDPTLKNANFKTLTDKQLDFVKNNPEREGFARAFTWYAMTRRAGDKRVIGLFDRALDMLRRMWVRMKDTIHGDRRMMDLFESIFDPDARRKDRMLPDRAEVLGLPGMTFGDMSMAYKAGKHGKPSEATKYASETIGARHAAELLERYKIDDPRQAVFVAVPSATRENHIPKAMAKQLAKLTGGKTMDLLDSGVKHERPGKGILRRLANPRQFISTGYPGYLPDDYRLILVDDSMHNGGAIRDAARQLWHTGVDVHGAVVGNKTGKTANVRPQTEGARVIRGMLGEEQTLRFEEVLGRPLDDQHFTEAELGEIRTRLQMGQSVDDFRQMLDQVKKIPGRADEAPMPSEIDRTRQRYDDVPDERERVLAMMRQAIQDGEMDPTWSGAKKFARDRLTLQETKEIFGYEKLTGKRNEPFARRMVETVLLQLGYGVRNLKWENVYERLNAVAEGRPSKVYSSLEGEQLFITRVDNKAQLTPLGQQALEAMEQAVKLGGEPAHVERVMKELAEKQAIAMQRLRAGRPIGNDIRRAIDLKKKILQRMGRKITDDPEYQAWDEAQNKPPREPVKPLHPKRIYAEPVAKVVESMSKIRRATELIDEPLGGWKLQTDRGLGYFPHYLGDARSVIGKMVRANGKAWEKAIKETADLKRTGKSESVRDVLNEVIDQENARRKARNLQPVTMPEDDSDFVKSLTEVLGKNPDLEAIQKLRIQRAFLRELTVAEINSVADQTGVAFRTNPVDVYRERRVTSHLATAGADFLKDVIKMGVEEGWVIPVKDKGVVPKGFDRIKDARYDNIAKGYAFSDDIVREFKKFTEVNSRPNVMLRALDFTTDLFRTSVLGVLPYTMTNLVSGVFQSNIFNAFNYRTWDGTQKMMRAIHAGETGKTVSDFVPGMNNEIAKYDIQDYYQLLAVEHGEMGKGMHGLEWEQAIKDGYNTSWSAVQEAKTTFRGKTKIGKLASAATGVYRDDKGLHFSMEEMAYFKGYRAFNTAVEDFMGMAFINERLRNGDSLDDAITKKRLALNQSADLTDTEISLFRRLIPFWGWMKGNAVLQWMAAIDRPQLAAAVTKIRGNLEATFAGEETLPPSMRPRHIAEEHGTQLTKLDEDGEAQFVNLSRFFPMRELSLTPMSGINLPERVATEVVGRLNPVGTEPLQQTFNYDFYWERPIKEYEGQMKKFLGVNVDPRVKRVLRMARPLNVIEQMSWRGIPRTGTDLAFGASQAMGVRAFPVDLKRQLYEAERAINNEMNAVVRDMKRARDKADRAGRDWREDPEVQRLAALYNSLNQQRQRLPLKTLRASTQSYQREARRERQELKDYARAE